MSGSDAAANAATRDQLLPGLAQPAPATASGKGAAPRNVSSGSSPPSPGCAIKGNINSRGDRIYHVPGGQYYAATVVDESSGERWFCSARDAEAAGFRAALS